MRDLSVLLVLIVLFVPNILSAQLAGPTAFLYWVLALFTFILPSAFVIVSTVCQEEARNPAVPRLYATRQRSGGGYGQIAVPVLVPARRQQ